MLEQPPDQRLVAEMDPVKRADGDDGAPVARAQAGSPRMSSMCAVTVKGGEYNGAGRGPLMARTATWR